MSRQNSDTLLIKNLDLLQELDEKAAQAISGGTDWMCIWPENFSFGIPPSRGATWHYYDYAQYQWVNTGYLCDSPGYITFT